MAKVSSMKMTETEFARQLAAATQRGEESLRSQPLAKAVSWDHSLGAVIDLSNGCRVCVPLSLLPELKHAQPRQLQNVELMGVGQAVQWPDLDQQFGVAELLADVWNADRLRPVAKNGGASEPSKSKPRRASRAKVRVPSQRKQTTSR
jgi:hypothetical protein